MEEMEDCEQWEKISIRSGFSESMGHMFILLVAVLCLNGLTAPSHEPPSAFFTGLVSNPQHIHFKPYLK